MATFKPPRSPLDPGDLPPLLAEFDPADWYRPWFDEKDPAMSEAYRRREWRRARIDWLKEKHGRNDAPGVLDELRVMRSEWIDAMKRHVWNRDAYDPNRRLREADR